MTITKILRNFCNTIHENKIQQLELEIINVKHGLATDVFENTFVNDYQIFWKKFNKILKSSHLELSSLGHKKKSNFI